MTHPNRQPSTHLDLVERFGVGVWRHALVPMFGILRGGSAPEGRVRELRYDAHADAVMDLYAASATPARSPVVFIHGGGWISGSKGRFYHRPLLGLADAGHPVYSVNYPLAPESPHPGPLRSLLGALAVLRREHGVERVHLAGDSAGGNLATMLGFVLESSELMRKVNGSPSFDGPLPQVLSVASLYGVLDRTSWLEDGFPSARLFLKSYAGAGALEPGCTPEVPITPMDIPSLITKTPTFIGVGTKDKLARSSRIYAEHLGAQGAPVTYKTYDGADHGFYCFAEPQGDALRADVCRFFGDVDANPGRTSRSEPLDRRAT
jgi:acetyl esterase/lipase